MTNKYRNELKIKLDATEYLLRGTFACLVEIESETGKTISQILDLAQDGTVPISHVFDILRAGATAVAPDLDEEALQTDITNVGLGTAAGYAIAFLVQAIDVPDELKKN